MRDAAAEDVGVPGIWWIVNSRTVTVSWRGLTDVAVEVYH